MSKRILLQNLSSDLFTKVLHRWFKRFNEKTMDPKTQGVQRAEGDWLAERPESWYQGPLIFPTFPEEGVTMYSHEGSGEVET